MLANRCIVNVMLNWLTVCWLLNSNMTNNGKTATKPTV